jgi:hypothetical protein
MRRPQVLILCLLAAGIARGDAARPTVIGVAGGGGDVALVGSLGEIYMRDGGVWRRQGGGVAATLSRAWGVTAKEVVAVGARQPAYAHDGTSWFALPGTTGMVGPALLSEPGSGVAAVAVGRRIFVVVDTGGRKLVPAAVATAPGLPTALLAMSARDVSVIVDGKVQYHAGSGGWRAVAGTEENLVALGPRLALGVDGGVYALETSSPPRLRKLAVDPTLAGFRPRLVAGGHAGKGAILVGALGDGYAAAVVDGGRVGLLGKLPGIARADEPVGIVTGDAGAPVVVVSRSGLVLSGDGKTWRTEAIATGVSESKHAAEPPAPVAPAPTRP